MWYDLFLLQSVGTFGDNFKPIVKEYKDVVTSKVLPSITTSRPYLGAVSKAALMDFRRIGAQKSNRGQELVRYAHLAAHLVGKVLNKINLSSLATGNLLSTLLYSIILQLISCEWRDSDDCQIWGGLRNWLMWVLQICRTNISRVNERSMLGLVKQCKFEMFTMKGRRKLTAMKDGRNSGYTICMTHAGKDSKSSVLTVMFRHRTCSNLSICASQKSIEMTNRFLVIQTWKFLIE